MLSKLSNPYKELELLNNSIDRDKIKLENLKKDVAQEDLKTDVKFYDTVTGFEEAYSVGDFNKIYNLAQTVIRSYNSDRTYDYNSNPIKSLKDYENSPKGHVMPKRFGLKMNIERGNIIMLGSPPGIGKTVVSLNLVLNYAKQRLQNVFFTWEMSKDQLWIRLFCINEYIENNESYSFFHISNLLKSNKKEYKDADHILYNKFYEFVKGASKFIHIYQCNGRPVSFALGILERLYNKLDKYPDFVYLDYIQLVEPELEVIRETKKVQMDVASRLIMNHCNQNVNNWIVVSQLNAEGGYKESGAMNQDAGMSIKLEREKDSEGEYIDEVTIKIEKSRFSKLGKSKVIFDGKSGGIG